MGRPDLSSRRARAHCLPVFATASFLIWPPRAFHCITTRFRAPGWRLRCQPTGCRRTSSANRVAPSRSLLLPLDLSRHKHEKPRLGSTEPAQSGGRRFTTGVRLSPRVPSRWSDNEPFFFVRDCPGFESAPSLGQAPIVALFPSVGDQDAQLDVSLRWDELSARFGALWFSPGFAQSPVGGQHPCRPRPARIRVHGLFVSRRDASRQHHRLNSILHQRQLVTAFRGAFRC